MDRVLLLIPTSTYRAAAFMKAATKLQLEVIVGTDQYQALSPLVSQKTLTLNFQNQAQAIQQIVQFAKKRPFKAVVGVDDDSVFLAAMANQALLLKHNPIDAVSATRNKYLMRQKLKDSQVLSPDIQLFSITTDPQSLTEQVPLPCVLKPTFLSGSRGVIRANTAEEFIDAFCQIRTLLSQQDIIKKNSDFARHILVEDYIPGVEVALEGLLVDGKLQLLALFDKPDPLEGPLFAETIYVTPSRLSPDLQQDIFRTVQQTVTTIGLQDGPVHAELRCNDKGVWPVEIAVRSIGGLCSRIFEFGRQFSLEELILRHALDEEISSLLHSTQAAGVMMIPISKQGTLKTVEGMERAQRVSGIENVVMSIPNGQVVEPLPNGDQYLGFIFARGASPAFVEQALREASACLKIEISDS
ncbi:MAG: ATP-grasp domain-containing protein [SAR324 cluster bacterium]|nr:ATP-grasp domain-containing protein [SAR324 cluster bacterium]